MSDCIAVNEKGYRLGASHQNARIPDEVVDLILLARANGNTYGMICVEFNLPKSTVASICKGYRRCQTPVRYKRGE